MTAPIAVVGLIGGEPYGERAAAAIAGADVLVGSPRHLESVVLALDFGVLTPRSGARTEQVDSAEQIAIEGPLDAVLDQVATVVDAGRRVCVLASGDPGFFGIVRVLAERFGADALEVHPAPSSVSLAFAALGLPWDDAVIASAHGRPLAAAVAAILAAPKAAVLTSPTSPPEAVGKALLEAGAAPRRAAVVTRIGEDGESITRTDLDGLATGSFDSLSVVVLWDVDHAAEPTLAWGLPESEFEHRDRMITKAEVRAVSLGKLALPRTGVLWDVGAGSGSVALECARLSPALAVYAVERDADQAERVRTNAAAHGVALTVVEGAAPDALADLPDPDRVFVGGGGLDVLDACLARLRPNGVVVANYAVVDRAAAAHERLGHLVQISVARGAPLAGVGVRLDAENPVFICWGPDHA